MLYIFILREGEGTAGRAGENLPTIILAWDSKAGLEEPSYENGLFHQALTYLFCNVNALIRLTRQHRFMIYLTGLSDGNFLICLNLDRFCFNEVFSANLFSSLGRILENPFKN